MKYAVNRGIASYVKETIWFFVSFDESLNEVTQTFEMDIFLRFWNKENNQVEDRYWDSKFLGHTSYQHLLSSVKEGLKVFEIAKIVQLSMDGPNVSLKILKKLKEQRNEHGSLGLINLGSLIYTSLTVPSYPVLRQVHGIRKILLKSSFQLLKDTLAVSHDRPSSNYNSVQPGFLNCLYFNLIYLST